MSAPLELRFVTSADHLDRLPESPAEVAVVGRSNVGKSSLINALANRNGLANVSKAPGRTQLLNCFELPDGTTMVDCPGYGYAKVSKVQRAGVARDDRAVPRRARAAADGDGARRRRDRADEARPVDARVAPGRDRARTR